MIKLHELPGAEACLPKKIEKFEGIRPFNSVEGFNMCRSELDSVGVEIDIKEIVQTLFLQGDLMSGERLEDCFERYAQAISQNKAILKLVKI